MFGRALPLVMLLGVPAARAEGPQLTPAQLAKVQHEEEKARALVDSAFGKRKSSELTNEERGEQIRLQQSEVKRVHEALEVDPKAHARQLARLPPEQREEMDAFKEALVADEAEARKADVGDEGIEIIHGLEEADAPTPAPEPEAVVEEPAEPAPKPKAPRAREQRSRRKR